MTRIETIGMNADKLQMLNAEDPIAFEKLMVEKIFPFLSANALIIGLFVLHSLEVVQTYWLIIPTIFIMIAIGAWRWVHTQDGPLSTILTGTFTVLAGLILYMTTDGVVYFVFGYLISAIFVYGVVRGVIPQGGMWFYMFYVPVLWGMIFEDDHVIRILVTFPLVLIVFFVFYIKKLNKAATASIAATVIVGVSEVFRVAKLDVALIILLGCALIAAIIYELKIINTGVSDFKMFVRQGVLVILMLLVIFAGYGVASIEASIPWTWFVLTVSYQGIQIYRSQDNSAARYGWIMTVFFIALLAETGDNNGLMIAIVMTLAALCNALIARRYQSRFLFNLSLFYLLYSLFVTLGMSSTSVSPAIILVGILDWACLVYLTGMQFIKDAETNRWWAGFIQEQDLATLKHYGNLMVDKLYKIPVIGGIASLISTLVTALKNVKGEGNPIGYADVLFVATQFMVIEVITNQVENMELFGLLPNWQQHTVELFVYVFFGLILFISGALSSNLFLRIIGIVIFLYPLGTNDIDDQVFQASTGYLYGVTGLVTGAVYTLYVSKKKGKDAVAQ
jgi:hypothetical protein